MFLLLACHRKDDSAEQLDCTPVDQYLPGGKSAPSGYEYCAVESGTGFVHRVEVVDVADDPYGDPDAVCSNPAWPNSCKTSADCEKGSVCEEEGDMTGCHCIPKCRTDADCDGGSACIPNLVSPGGNESGMWGKNECLPAECVTDADCPSGWCVLHSSACGPQWAGGLHCFSDKDECRTASDCPDGIECYSTGGPFVCGNSVDCE